MGSNPNLPIFFILVQHESSTLDYAATEPYRPEFSDLDYADVDYRSYGPINYKKASIDVLEQQNRAPSVDNQQRPTRPPKNPSPDLL
uniref:Uncharacterized protein n=1 Tax=Timema douglasi TaxID=61478 RepID=A0A7R8Z7Z4_TIMDO|nr:unnamed protein product [Timema douglasi]